LSGHCTFEICSTERTPVGDILVIISDDGSIGMPEGFIHVTFIISVPFITQENITLSSSRTVILLGADCKLSCTTV